MNTLWTFGDSFTFGHGCRVDGPMPEYFFEYKKETDDIWPNLLGKMLNVQVKNFGKCGASNDYIIDSIIDNWDNFKKNDFIIIGITYYGRFDVPYDGKLESISYFDEKYLSTYSLYKKEEIETIINFYYHFSNHKLYKNRQLKRLNFLIKLLKEKKINTYDWDIIDFINVNLFEKIISATNNKILDEHFSFKGHREFANMMYKKITSPTLI
jgi:hypothetical protein